MKRNYFFTIVFAALVVLSATSCKSKQQTVKVTGASKVAGTTKTTESGSSASSKGTGATSATPSTSQGSAIATTQYGNEEEVTRNEKFELAEASVGTSVTTAAINKKYHVVVGSFRSRDNAKGLQSSLNAEGNNAIIVINEMGMYRVLLNSFDTYSEARSLINSISNRFSDAWVLVQK